MKASAVRVPASTRPLRTLAFFIIAALVCGGLWWFWADVDSRVFREFTGGTR